MKKVIIIGPESTGKSTLSRQLAEHYNKVWCEVAFQKCHTWILKQIASRKYDFYLLCCTDLPWQQDALREYPELSVREKIFKMYKDIAINSGGMWSEISGTDAQRLQMAVSIIDTVFKRPLTRT